MPHPTGERRSGGGRWRWEMGVEMGIELAWKMVVETDVEKESMGK